MDGFFSAISSSSKASRSEYYARFRFFDLTKNKLITNIRYFENAAQGDLIDSAHNNLRRLIVTQYQESQKIIYDQDFGVSIQNYQQMDTQDIIDLWTLMNRQFVRTMRRTPPERYHLDYRCRKYACRTI